MDWNTGPEADEPFGAGRNLDVEPGNVSLRDDDHDAIVPGLGNSRVVEHGCSEKRSPGCLGYRGDEILPNYLGIMKKNIIRILINQPVIIMESGKGFFRGSHGCSEGSK